MYFLRNIVRNRLLDILGALSKPANGIHILNGHRIQNELEPETFRKLLAQLSKYVEFVRIENAIKMILDNENKSYPHPYVAFTFDDGFMECYDYFAPELEKYGVNALFFVNPNYVEGDSNYVDKFNNTIVMTPNKIPMRWEHLTELSARGHIIGAHTIDHYMINTNEIDILKFQIENCKHIIEQHIGMPCEHFAFPYGKLSHANETAINIACRTYKYIFSQSDYKHYFSFDGRVINRRHFEPFWPINHLKYFLSCNKK